MSDAVEATTEVTETATEDTPDQTTMIGAETTEATTEATETTEEAKEEAKADVVPESYADFTLPENVTIQPEALEAFKGIAKDFKLTQEKAQELLDRYQSEIMPKNMQAIT